MPLGWAHVEYVKLQRSLRDGKVFDTSLGMHFTDLPTAALHAGTTLRFTFRWREDGRWQDEDFACVVVSR